MCFVVCCAFERCGSLPIVETLDDLNKLKHVANDEVHSVARAEDPAFLLHTLVQVDVGAVAATTRVYYPNGVRLLGGWVIFVEVNGIVFQAENTRLEPVVGVLVAHSKQLLYRSSGQSVKQVQQCFLPLVALLRDLRKST